MQTTFKEEVKRPWAVSLSDPWEKPSANTMPPMKCDAQCSIPIWTLLDHGHLKGGRGLRGLGNYDATDSRSFLNLSKSETQSGQSAPWSRCTERTRSCGNLVIIRHTPTACVFGRDPEIKKSGFCRPLTRERFFFFWSLYQLLSSPLPPSLWG